MNMHLNKERRRELFKYLAIGSAGALGIGLVLYLFLGTPNKTSDAVNQATKPNFVTIDDAQFNSNEATAEAKDQQTTIAQQQTEITTLEAKQSDLESKMQQAQTQGNNSPQVAALQQQLDQLSAQLASGKAKLGSSQQGFNPNALGGGADDESGAPPAQIQTFTLSFAADTPKTDTLSSKNYVPSGTKILAVLVGAADANASVTGQSNTTPVAFTLVSDAIEPTQEVNGIIKPVKTPLKGCSIIGSTYGDISSERAEIRLVRLSCNMADGSILDIPVEGTVFEGLAGIKGTPIMRNGEILTWAGLSGILGGFGQAMQQNESTVSTSPLGTTTSVTPGQAVQSGLYGGVGSSMNMLSQYYIQRAEQYHPIIEIRPGTIVTVLFTQGFSLKPAVKNSNTASNSENEDSASFMSGASAVGSNQGSIGQAQALMQQISSHQGGQ